MESLETLRQKAQQALDACKDRKAQEESGRTIGSALAEVLGEIKNSERKNGLSPQRRKQL